MTTQATGACSHGSVSGGFNLRSVAAIMEDVESLLNVEKKLPAKVERRIWTRVNKFLAKCSPKGDPEDGRSRLIPYLHAVAANQLLAENKAAARTTCIYALGLRMLKEEVPTLEICCEQVNVSERGLVLYVAKHVPCECLREKKCAAKKMTRMGFCAACHRTIPASQMFQCSRCKSEFYCSASCQHQCWEAHKFQCEDRRKAQPKQAAPKKKSKSCTQKCCTSKVAVAA